MGRVLFQNGVATPESRAWLMQNEQAILRGEGDENLKARKIEFLYRENGLVPGTWERAGGVEYAPKHTPQVSDNGSRFGSGPGGGFMSKIIGWCIGFALIYFAVAYLNNFGHHTAKEDAEWHKYQVERCNGGNKNACWQVEHGK